MGLDTAHFTKGFASRAAAAALAAVMVTATPPAPARPAEAPALRFATATPTCPTGTTDRIDRCPGDLISREVAPRIDAAAFRPGVSGDVHVWLLSSGVQAKVLPDVLRSRIKYVKPADLDSDNIGYGTYLASVILQLVPNAVIHPINVYPDLGGTLRSFRELYAALGTVRASADRHVVLLGFPPSDFLDPVMGMANVGSWSKTLDAMSDFSGTDPDATGPYDSKFGIEGATVLGIPLDQPQWDDYQLSLSRDSSTPAGLPTKQGSHLYLDKARGKWLDWEGIQARIQQLVAAGIPVVAPAGDLADPANAARSLQTIFGVASLGDVITVGAAQGSGVAPTGSSGPGLGGGDRLDPTNRRARLAVKPDLLAPAGLVGILPDGEALLTTAMKDKIDSSLVPSWVGDVGVTPGQNRALLNTSLTSAALVAAQLAALRAQGVTSVARQRGALRAAVEPIAGEFVWRQGMGVLKRSPLGLFPTGTDARPLVLDNGDLTTDMQSGQTGGQVRIAGGKPETVSIAITQFAGLDIRGQNVARTVSIAPPVTWSLAECAAAHHATDPDPPNAGEHGHDCVVLEVNPSGAAPGYYCGFLEMKFADEQADQLVRTPTCFIKGMSVTAHADYISGHPASVVTYQLVPTLPETNKLPFHPMVMFPVDANRTAIELYEQDTNEAGDAVFPVVLPGYYDFRLMADYGNPIDANMVPPPSAAQTSSPSASPSPSPSPSGLATSVSPLPSVVSPSPTLSPTASPLPSLSVGAAGGIVPLSDGSRVHAAAVAEDFVELVESDRTERDELGHPMTYFRSFAAFVLPPALCDAAGGTAGCQQALSTAFGQPVTEDPETKTLQIAGKSFAFGRAARTIGASVASRSIDIIPCVDVAADATASWKKSCPADEIRADFAGGGLDLIGELRYTFYTPRPTYRYRLALNFAYKLDNAAIIVEVAGGKAPPGEGLAMAASALRIPENIGKDVETGARSIVAGKNVFSNGENKANIIFTRFLEGYWCDPCTIKLRLVPIGGIQGKGLTGGKPVLANVRIRDLSFKLETWTKQWWPSTKFVNNTVDGNSLRLMPAFDPFKIGSRCAAVPARGDGFDGPRNGPRMCEDWVLMLHAPKYSAALKEIYYCGDVAVQVDRADPAQCERGTNAKPIFGELRTTKAAAFWDPQKEKGAGWPFFPAGHNHTFHGPVSIGVHHPCMTSGRGKFWKQLVLGNRGIHQVSALPGYSPTTTTLEFRMYARVVDTPAEYEGPVPVARFEAIAAPAGFVLAAPPFSRLLLILGLVAAALIAGAFQWRRSRRPRRA